MSDNLYEVLALGMRYWFALLGLIVVLRSFLWLRRDRRKQHRRLRRLPDAGTVGELVVVKGTREMPEGAVIAVPWEGVLGYNRTCDIVIPAPGVAFQHLDFSFEERRGLLLTLRRKCTCTVDGQLLTPRTRARKYPMLHGSTLEIGEAVLKLRVFAGIEVEHHVALADNVPPSPNQALPYVPFPEQTPPPYQAPPYPAWQNAPGSWQPLPPSAPMPPMTTPPLPPQAGSSAGYFPPQYETPAADLPMQDEPAPRPRRRRAGRRDADA